MLRGVSYFFHCDFIIGFNEGFSIRLYDIYTYTPTRVHSLALKNNCLLLICFKFIYKMVLMRNSSFL
ncbi:hypothetical protein HanRHA438_Chr14g0632451 [Helianthus annuus]|nr:hypothetical protein HanRHA438_Chr14g0632451 [Helianthus annuus]